MTAYQDICRQIETLTSDEQLRLLEEIAAIVRRLLVLDELVHPQEMV
jgi:hypothetical protein